MIRIAPGKRTTSYGFAALVMIAAGTALVVLVPAFGQHYSSYLTGIGGWLMLMLGANTGSKWAPGGGEEPAPSTAAKPAAKVPEVLG